MIDVGFYVGHIEGMPGGTVLIRLGFVWSLCCSYWVTNGVLCLSGCGYARELFADQVSGLL